MYSYLFDYLDSHYLIKLWCWDKILMMMMYLFFMPLLYQKLDFVFFSSCSDLCAILIIPKQTKGFDINYGIVNSFYLNCSVELQWMLTMSICKTVRINSFIYLLCGPLLHCRVHNSILISHESSLSLGAGCGQQRPDRMFRYKQARYLDLMWWSRRIDSQTSKQT